jgi:EpsI family protein
MHRAFRLDFPKPAANSRSAARWTPPKPYLGAVALVLLAAMGSIAMGERVEAALERQSLVTFPMRIGDWKGRQFALDGKILDTLDVDDYMMADFRRPRDANRINLYVAYYASQRAGQAAHSPRSCIPGGGWAIEDLTQRSIDNVIPGGQTLGVNRVVIKKGNVRQLVYYWFRQQGRNLTNEYVIKWYLFWDGVTRNRTDGALIRLVTPLRDGDGFDAADQRLSGFVRAVYSPLIPAYVPQ